MIVEEIYIPIIGAIATLAGIQFTFGWRFHGVYVNIHKEFSTAVNDAQKRKLDEFADNLYTFFQKLVVEVKDEKIQVSQISKKQIASIMSKKEYQQQITKWAEIIREQEKIGEMYKDARDNAKSVYQFLLVSGGFSLLGLIPVINPSYLLGNLWYVMFALPLWGAISAWLAYHSAESYLVKLRDEPLLGANDAS